MEVVVVGKHVKVPAELQQSAKEKVSRVERFASDIRRIEVDFGETRNPSVADGQTCEILVHVNGHLIKGHAAAGDQNTALDLALERVDHQMRRLHERRTTRNGELRKGVRNHAD